MFILKRAICIFLAILMPLMAHSEGLHFKTVVLDAGHGGKDFGASSADKRTHEKNINLDVALRLKKLINEAAPDVKVVMTRSTDVFVPLADRAEIANKANANLFISIHVNSYFRTAPHGSSVHVLGQSSRQDRDLFAFNQEICRRENSVIYLENDYTTRYEGFDPSDEESLIFMTLMQSAYLEQSIRFAEIVDKNMKATGPFSFSRGLSQDPFFVLWKTAMPAVLVELGFLSNAADLAVLRDGSNLEKIAKSLLSAFLEYKSEYDESLN